MTPPQRQVGLTILLLALGVRAEAEWSSPAQAPRFPDDKGPQSVVVVDGSVVHTVGELQLNITNWGLIGSQPSLTATYSDAPSAMWPAGSGVDYLFAAGLWVGGLKNGVPVVSTGQFENEFLPTPHPLDTIYRSAEGDEGGSRYPFPGEDDDGDGFANEDPKNGFDDDGDGSIDEDFGAISEQQFEFRMYDNLPILTQMWPDHDPLGIEVTQKSIQWSNPRLEDTIGFEYTIRNIGSDTIEDLAVGFFADGDVGPRGQGAVSEDDMVGYFSGSVVASDGVPVNVSIAYMYDCDGDEKQAPGYIGFVFLNSTFTPLPVFPSTFQYFAGTAPFERGGDPTTDAERYALMVSGEIDTPPSRCERANDYRVLLAFRPSGGFIFPPRASVRFQMAMVVGESVEDMTQNAAEILITYYGDWYDRDQDSETGINGRELKVCKSHFGDPNSPTNPIFNLFVDCGYPPDCFMERPRRIQEDDLDEDGCIWINGDCAYEQSRGTGCGVCTNSFTVSEFPNACTGVFGKEFNVRWIAEAPPPPPPLRVRESHNQVNVYWGSDPESVVDPIRQLPVFESYRVWRSDGWDRPFGTSTETGPPSMSWKLLAEFDLVNTYENRIGNIVETLPLGANTGLEVVQYEPGVFRPGTRDYEEFADLRDLTQRIVTDNPFLPPRTRVRYLDDRGRVTGFGERYPELEEWSCCPAVIDTLVMGQRGLHFYEFVDRDALNGFYYFYAVTVTTLEYDEDQPTVTGYGPEGRPRSNFEFAIPRSEAQSAEERAVEGHQVYVVPNPVTRERLAEFSQLHPNSDDPTGVRIEFRNLPAAANVVRIFTLSGDLVDTLLHDGRHGNGSLSWNLVSRKGQEIVSGIYLYSVESHDSRFDRVIGRFVVIR